MKGQNDLGTMKIGVNKIENHGEMWFQNALELLNDWLWWWIWPNLGRFIFSTNWDIEKNLILSSKRWGWWDWVEQ